MAVEATKCELLVESEFENARMVARTWPGVPSYADRDGLEGAALEGLFKASRTYDPDKGPFGPWAYSRVRWAILDFMREQDWLSRNTRGSLDKDSAVADQDLREVGVLVDARGPVSLDQLTGDQSEGLSRPRIETLCDPTAEALHRRAEDRLTLLERFRHLPDRELAIIVLRFFGDYTEREIGDLFGLTESRICQLQGKATDRMSAGLSEQTAAIDDVTFSEEAAKPLMSPREGEVLAHIANGLSNATIAQRMFLSEETIKVHVRHILSKMGVCNRAHAVSLGWALGFLT